MNDWWLAMSRNHQAMTTISGQLSRDCFDPHLVIARCRMPLTDAQLGGNRPRDPLDIIAAYRQPMVRFRAGARHGRFDDIQPVHRRPSGLTFIIWQLPARHEVSRISQMSWPRRQKVCVQRKNNLSLSEVVNRIYFLAKCQAGPAEAVVVMNRLILMPPRAR